MENYKFVPQYEMNKIEQEPAAKPRCLEITVAGSIEQDRESNLREYGKVIAERIVESIKKTKSEGKKLVFDMATGSTPKAVWPELQSLLALGEVDLSNVIVIGHEEAWGTYEPGSHSDFDAYRKNFLSDNGVSPVEITDTVAADGEIEGNFVPMHLESVDRSDFPDGNEGDSLFYEAEEKAAGKSADDYEAILKSLRDREDTEFFGLYGVGTDGHVGEMQISTMGKAQTLERRNMYSDSLESYSVEKGLHYWQDEGGNFLPENNVFWQRGAEKDESVGRAVWQGYSNMHEAVGIGWRDLIKEDKIVLAFNDSSKSLALRLALEGAFSGEIVDGDGQSIKKIEEDRGEGEAIIDDLKSLLNAMRAEGIISEETINNLIDDDKTDCDSLFNAAYHALDNAEASSDNKYYPELWKLTNRYLGRRSPIGRLVKLRTMFDKDTEIVTTPEVLKETPYSKLADK